MTVKELKKRLENAGANDNDIIKIVIVDENGIKKVGVIDFGIEGKEVYITGVITDQPYLELLETYNSFQKLIGELSIQDYLASKEQKKKVKGYSLSANTLYIIECRDQFMSGEITEEEAKAIILKQKLCGKAI